MLFFAGSGSSAVRFDSPLFGDEAEGIFTSVVWDPPGNQFTHPATLRTANGTPFDFFCGGDAFLPDGRMLSAGGTLDYNPFKGRNDAAIFDFTTETWSVAAPMAHGRWYPTLTALADGRILATTGLNENGDGHNQQLEFYTAATDAWTAKEFVGGFAGLPLYAHLFLLADGRIFFSGGRMDDPLDVQPCIFDPSQTPVPTNAVPDLLEPDFRNQSASVLLPPAQDQRVMVIGGGPVGKQDQTDATGAVSIADLTEADPHYLAATPMGLPRLHLNAVLLPDRTVFVSGGSLKQEDQPLARLEGEIYDPATDELDPHRRRDRTPAVPLHRRAAARRPRRRRRRKPRGRIPGRLDTPGRGGGDEAGGVQPALPVQRPPPNDHRGTRPRPPTARQSPSTHPRRPPSRRSPSSATASPPTPSTASSDWSTSRSPAETAAAIQVAVPVNPNLAPPGWYMIFLVDTDGVPSVATWIQLAP